MQLAARPAPGPPSDADTAEMLRSAGVGEQTVRARQSAEERSANHSRLAGSTVLLSAATDRLAGVCRLHAEEQAAAAAATKAAAQEAAAVRQSQQQEQAQATAAAERLAASRLQAETTADAAGRASHLPHVKRALATDLTRTELRRRGQSDCPGDAHLRRRQGPRHLRSLHQVNVTVVGPVASI